MKNTPNEEIKTVDDIVPEEPQVKRKKLSTKAIVIIAVVSAVLIALGITLAVCITNYLGIDTSVLPPETTAPVTEPVETTTEFTDEDYAYPDGTPYPYKQDWAALAKINTDIKAWITLPHTPINYPVLKSEEDGVGYQYYLHRYYDKSYDYAGSLFIDYRSTEGVNSRNIIVHGHSMNDGSMFASLIDYGKYEGKLDMYKKIPTLFFNTPEGNEQWIIFSVYKTSTLESHGDFFNYLMGSFDNDAQFMNYVYNVKERSLFDVPVPINEDDQLITLSTCSYEYEDFRTIVCARKIRDGEDVRPYIEAATLDPDPVWPDVHYYNSDKERPEITTFRTEYEKGTLDWYDGKGNLEGNEWLKTTSGTKNFIVTFINYDGSVIDTQIVPYGHAAKAPADPVKPSNDYYDYVFKGWGYDFSYVDCNMTIAPKFEKVPKQ